MQLHAPLYAEGTRRLRGSGLLIGVSLLCACARGEKKGELAELRVEAPRGHFARAGFFEMVPPLRLPLRSRRHRVEVWLKVPDGGTLSTTTIHGRSLLELPAGSEAARVESIATGRDSESWEWTIADVRGTRFERAGEVFYVLRPADGGASGALRGYSWPRSSSAQQELANDAVARLVSDAARPESRAREAAAARKNNACVGCHQHGRLANDIPGRHGLANRGTDASGCYQVQGILDSRLPLESYFPLEMNLDDGFISFECGSEPARVNRSKGRVSCVDGSVPWGRLDLRAALSASDPHAMRVCASRRYLFDHADARTRAIFHEGFAECGLLPPTLATDWAPSSARLPPSAATRSAAPRSTGR